MPYTLSPANADCWSVGELEAATKAFSGPFANPEERRAARQRYDAVMEAKRNSGYQLPSEPLLPSFL
jgi:hypothetical protein